MFSSNFEVDHASNIEEIVKRIGINYIDAIIHYCETNNYEFEVIGNFVKKCSPLKEKVQYEAENLNFLEKSPRLPI